MGTGRRRVRGEDVSSLTSILLLAVDASCCHSSPRACVPTGSRGAPDDGAFRRGAGGVGIVDMLLFPWMNHAKLKLSHLVFFPTFVFSVSPLSLPAVSLSHHRPATVWVNEGLGSTLRPLQASIQLGKDCPLLW